jgi:hypothetical protein
MQLSLKESGSVLVTDVCLGSSEELSFQDAVTILSVGYGRAVIATLLSVKVFAADASLGSSAAVASVDLHGILIGIQLAPSCFMLVRAGQPPQVCGTATVQKRFGVAGSDSTICVQH